MGRRQDYISFVDLARKQSSTWSNLYHIHLETQHSLCIVDPKLRKTHSGLVLSSELMNKRFRFAVNPQPLNPEPVNGYIFSSGPFYRGLLGFDGGLFIPAVVHLQVDGHPACAFCHMRCMHLFDQAE